MKQLFQSLRDGSIELLDIPAPRCAAGEVLIRTTASLISPGTERMLLDFGNAGWLGKARQQPEKVRQVAHKLATDGLAPTLEAVQSRLGEPLPLGYCNVGVVKAAGAEASGFGIGERIVSNGHHAELVSVPPNLCAKVPDGVSDEQAAFTVLGAIALQSVRLAEPTLGETFVVIGLGMVGLLAVQILRANGCRVLGVDVLPERVAIARSLGAETLAPQADQARVEAAWTFTRGRGADGVIVATAAGGKTPLDQASRMCRKRGRIILVGAAEPKLSRSEFYQKELSFRVSCAYGPGRYDPDYEQRGRDYPLAYVRWTAQRNFEAVLDLLAAGQLRVEPLISHRFEFEQAVQAYGILRRREPSLGLLLTYGDEASKNEKRTFALALAPTARAQPSGHGVSVIGAGNYAARMLIPAFRQSGAEFDMIANTGSGKAAHIGRRYGFRAVTTDIAELLASPRAAAVVIATRHDSHAELVCQALLAGKHVFVEKPLALSMAELERVRATYTQAEQRGGSPLLMVGFNRRFAPHIQTMKALLAARRAPKSMIMTVNAGPLPAEHWLRDRHLGGGRIIGECCHFIDLLYFLNDAPSTHFEVMGYDSRAGADDAIASIAIEFADGSHGVIHYFSNGHRRFPKERIEVFCGGSILQLDNFRTLRRYGWGRRSGSRLLRQDKGQRGCVEAFMRAVAAGGPSPIAAAELFDISSRTLEIDQALHT
jgi:predicted dehydrogenase/threonine dehydrogenase-like Zn-dependent dehydrogenase